VFSLEVAIVQENNFMNHLLRRLHGMGAPSTRPTRPTGEPQHLWAATVLATDWLTGWLGAPGDLGMAAPAAQ